MCARSRASQRASCMDMRTCLVACPLHPPPRPGHPGIRRLPQPALLLLPGAGRYSVRSIRSPSSS
eukprot:15243441-Alexandrium_andersonii.AAC.1